MFFGNFAPSFKRGGYSMYKTNTSTEYRKELRQKILKTATEEFRSKGIRAVKMDDIANILSVSKRTVYEIYVNKEQLLMECVREEHKKFDLQMLNFTNNGKRHVIDIILEFYRLRMRSLTNVNPVYFSELHRYPEIIKWIEDRHSQNQNNTQAFFEQGIEEGYFRADLNYALISEVCRGSLNYIMEKQLYKQYELKEIFRDVIMLYIRGMCTLKGITELDKQIAELNK